MKNVRLGKLIVGDGMPSAVVAELCNNMRGDLDVAIEMVNAAWSAGALAIKAQLRYRTGHLRLRDIGDLMAHCSRRGISFGCTAFDVRGLDALKEMRVDWIKLGSGQVTDADFLQAAAKTGIPLVISTGGCSLSDVGAIWHIMMSKGAEWMLMQCTSIYPTPYNRVNLGVIPKFRELYRVPIGLSCHTATIYTGIAAVAYGAAVIEKHFTLDRSQPGPDQNCSLEPAEFAQLVAGVRAAFMASGSHKVYYPEERIKLDPIRNPPPKPEGGDPSGQEEEGKGQAEAVLVRPT